MAQSYWELLKDPRWQRKRLEVMERDLWTCTQCGCETNTLNVHHSYYERGKKPWEYPSESLRTLCEECHAKTTAQVDEAKRILGSLPNDVLDEVIGYLRARYWIELGGCDPIPLTNYPQVAGFLSGFGVIGWWMRDAIAARIAEAGNECRAPRAMQQIASEQSQHLRAFYDRNLAERAAKEHGEAIDRAIACVAGADTE